MLQGFFIFSLIFYLYFFNKLIMINNNNSFILLPCALLLNILCFVVDLFVYKYVQHELCLY